MLDALNITQRRDFGYISPTHPVPIPGQTIRDNLQMVKESGYRTIVVTMDNHVVDLPIIADVADELGLSTKDYLWIFLPPFEVNAVQTLIEYVSSLRCWIIQTMLGSLLNKVYQILCGIL